MSIDKKENIKNSVLNIPGKKANWHMFDPSNKESHQKLYASLDSGEHNDLHIDHPMDNIEHLDHIDNFDAHQNASLGDGLPHINAIHHADYINHTNIHINIPHTDHEELTPIHTNTHANGPHTDYISHINCPPNIYFSNFGFSKSVEKYHTRCYSSSI
jgi:hypothetical protein